MQDRFDELMDDLFERFDFVHSDIRLADLLDLGLFLARRYGAMPPYPFPMVYSTIQSRLSLQLIEDLIWADHWTLAQFETFLLRAEQLYITKIADWQQLAGPHAQRLTELVADAKLRYLPLATVDLAADLDFKPNADEKFYGVEQVTWYQNTDAIQEFDERVALPGNVAIITALKDQLHEYSPQGTLVLSNQRLVHHYRDANGELVIKQLQVSKLSAVKIYQDAVLIWMDQLPLLLKTANPNELGTLILRLMNATETDSFVTNGLTIDHDQIVLTKPAANEIFHQAKDQLTTFAGTQFELTFQTHQQVVDLSLLLANDHLAARVRQLLAAKDVVKWQDTISTPLLKIIFRLLFIGYDVNLEVIDPFAADGATILLEMLAGNLTVNLGVGLQRPISQFNNDQLIMNTEAGLIDRRSLKYLAT